MVKQLFAVLFLSLSLWGADHNTTLIDDNTTTAMSEIVIESEVSGSQQEKRLQTTQEIQEDVKPLSHKEMLDEKIISYIGEESFARNRDYIHINFKNVNSFYIKENINVVKVVETLEENGLLHLFFKEPQQYEMTFHSTGDPLFFVKLMGDTLRDIGYYRYVTKEATQDESGFEWKISLEAEYVTDPVLLRKELDTRGCKIVDIIRVSATDWHYDIDTSKAHLKAFKLRSGEVKKYKRLQYAKWLDVSGVKVINIKSHRANFWYPYIAFYDSSLRLLKVIKKDEETKTLKLTLPESTRYISVSDLYTMSNIRYGLEFKASGKR